MMYGNKTSVPATEESITDFNIVYLFLVVIILAVGCFFNILTLVLMSRKNLRGSAVSVYLQAIVLGDTLLLIANIPLEVAGLFPGRIIYPSEAICVVSTTLIGVSWPLPAWYLMIMTIDRSIAIVRGSRIDISNQRRRRIARYILIAATVFWIVCNLYNFWAWELDSDGRTCSPRLAYRFFKYKVNIWMLSTLSSFIPSVVIFICNTQIAFSLYKSVNAVTGQESQRALKRMNILILTVSVSFLVLTVPRAIYESLIRSEVLENNTTIESVVFLLFYMNHSLNFFLYVLTKSKFKQELISMCDAFYVCGNRKRTRSLSSFRRAAMRLDIGQPSSTATTSSMAAPSMDLSTLSGITEHFPDFLTPVGTSPLDMSPEQNNTPYSLPTNTNPANPRVGCLSSTARPVSQELHPGLEFQNYETGYIGPFDDSHFAQESATTPSEAEEATSSHFGRELLSEEVSW